MLIKNSFLKYFSFLLSALFIAYVIYIIISSFFIVKNQFIDIGDSTYVNQVRQDEYTIKLANFLTKFKDANSSICLELTPIVKL